jgi:hypothetical protein
MPDINRYRVNWTGFTGSPGVSTFYSLASSTAALAALRAFFADAAYILPPSVTLEFPNSGDTLDSTTGTLVGGWTASAQTAVTGLASVGYFAAGTGARLVWETDSIVDGRRVRGSTFLVPLSTSAYDTNGSLISGAFTTVNGPLATLVATNQLVIWSRPVAGDSAVSAVTGASLPDKVSTLRTRRL